MLTMLNIISINSFHKMHSCSNNYGQTEGERENEKRKQNREEKF